MDEQERRTQEALGPHTERGGGDNVAGAGRSERAAGAGFSPKGRPLRTASTREKEPSRLEKFTGEQRLLL